MKKLFTILLLFPISYFSFSQSLPLVKNENYQYNMIYDIEQNRYIDEFDFIKKYGKDELNKLVLIDKYQKKGYLNRRDQKKLNTLTNSESIIVNGVNYSIKMKPINTIVGTSLIGISAATYLISSSAIDNIMEKTYDIDKLKKLNNTKRTIGYVSGGIAIGGVITIITGIRKDYNNGIQISENLFLYDTPNELGFRYNF